MGNFVTKIDYSDNRQIKQNENTYTELSGATEFGVTYSALTSGPDLSTSGITEILTCIEFVFSGNENEIIFAFDDDTLDIAAHTLSPITNVNSGDTQLATLTFGPNEVTTIDNNLVVLSYTGITYEVIPTEVTSGGNGTFTGSGNTDNIMIFSANSLDYNGRLIWVDVNGITRTEKLIIKNNAVVGKIFTCINSEGMGEWGDLMLYSGTPSSTTDPSGDIGNIWYDDEYLYWKGNSGWVRTQGEYWE